MEKNVDMEGTIMETAEFGKDNGETIGKTVMESSKIKKELSLKDIGLMG